MTATCCKPDIYSNGEGPCVFSPVWQHVGGAGVVAEDVWCLFEHHAVGLARCGEAFVTTNRLQGT